MSGWESVDCLPAPSYTRTRLITAVQMWQPSTLRHTPHSCTLEPGFSSSRSRQHPVSLHSTLLFPRRMVRAKTSGVSAERSHLGRTQPRSSVSVGKCSWASKRDWWCFCELSRLLIMKSKALTLELDEQLIHRYNLKLRYTKVGYCSKQISTDSKIFPEFLFVIHLVPRH